MGFGQRRVHALSDKQRKRCPPSQGLRLRFAVSTISFFFFNMYLFFFSCIRSQLCHVGSFVAARRLSPECWCSVVVVHGLSCSRACRILVPQPGMEVRSPALPSEFLTTGPPGKPQDGFFIYIRKCFF